MHRGGMSVAAGLRIRLSEEGSRRGARGEGTDWSHCGGFQATAGNGSRTAAQQQPAVEAAAEQGRKPPADAQAQGTQQLDAQQKTAIKEVPGPIRFELTSRMELKYEQTFLEGTGYVIRPILLGSYAIPSLRMSFGFDEIPMVRINTPGHSEDWMMGDIILRHGYVPYISPDQNFGLVYVTNLTLPTGDFDGGGGAGRYDLEPRLFLPYKFNKTYTIVPAVYEKFTIAKKEDGVENSNLLTLRLINLIYTSPGSYIIVEPRLYHDFEARKTSGELRFQFGSMLTRNLGAYLEYSAGIGGERYFDGRAIGAFRYFFH